MPRTPKPSISPSALGFERPLTTVDLVVFTVRENRLHALLVRRPTASSLGEPFPGAWALPGGFVDTQQDASLEATARRKLIEKTGVKTPYLEQLGSWGSANRDPRGWSTTHVFFALIPSAELELRAGGNSSDVEWVAVDEGIEHCDFAFDHQSILDTAIQRLRSKVEYTSLPAHLLAQPFTLPQLQKSYEAVLNRTVDKSGFRTRMLAAGFLEEADLQDVGAPRPAMGYRLRDQQAIAYFPRTFSPRGE